MTTRQDFGTDNSIWIGVGVLGVGLIVLIAALFGAGSEAPELDIAAAPTSGAAASALVPGESVALAPTAVVEQVAPTAMVEESTSAEPTAVMAAGAEPTAAVVADAGAPPPHGEYPPEMIARGANLFTPCTACHGFNAMGVPGLGKNLVDSTFVSSLTDEQLLDFMITGRTTTDPMNTTGVGMPGKGGTAYTNEQMMDVIAYMRSINIAQADPAVAEAYAGSGSSETTSAEPVGTAGPTLEAPGFTPLNLSGLAVPTSAFANTEGQELVAPTPMPFGTPTPSS
jgi:mono/diheme cytochrome c family protein